MVLAGTCSRLSVMKFHIPEFAGWFLRGELLGEETNRYFWFSTLSVEKTCVFLSSRREYDDDGDDGWR